MRIYHILVVFAFGVTDAREGNGMMGWNGVVSILRNLVILFGRLFTKLKIKFLYREYV